MTINSSGQISLGGLTVGQSIAPLIGIITEALTSADSSLFSLTAKANITAYGTV